MEDLTLAEQTYSAIRKDIISGDLEAGQLLRLEYLKKRYGISFSPIREALNRLHSERLVELLSSRGFRVVPFSIKEMWDVIETRILIDSEAVRKSLEKADDEWETKLIASFHALRLSSIRAAELDPAAATYEDEIVQARHLDFHRTILIACDSPWLLELSGMLYAQTERYRRPVLRGSIHRDRASRVNEEHVQIFDAAVARDAQLTVALLARHYRATGRMIQEVTERNRSATTPRT